ncbi:MAG: L-arabinose ABC transporter permease AraH [Spirochaetia bacterium]|jgi:L-arabinose transport system permease protein
MIAGTDALSRGRRLAAWVRGAWSRYTSLLILLVLFAASSLCVPHFLSWINIIGLGLSVSMVGMVACSMLFCLAAGGFDLSVESVVAFSGVLAAVVINSSGSVLEGVLAGVLAGGLVGAVNGAIVSYLSLNPLITTLAVMQIVRGLGFLVSQGSAVGVNNSDFFFLGAGRMLSIPNPIWITLFLMVLFAFLFKRTSFGKNTLAVGGSETAARLKGITVSRTKLIIYIIQGLIAGLAGVVLASRMTSGQPNTSQGFSMDVISACVLGGVSLSGGVGTLSGTIIGVLIMGTVQNAMNLLNIPTFYQYILRGLILLIAVLLDQLKRKSR